MWKKFQVAENMPNIVLDGVYPSGCIVPITMKLPRLKCLRCGYVWIPKQDEKPLRCASKECKSPYWDRPRRKKAVAA
jgi:hypothetical protein